MRIGLNLLHAQPGIGGGWNYIANLVSGLAENNEGDEFFAFVTEDSAGIVPRDSGFRLVKAAIRPSSRIMRIGYENVWLPLAASRLKLDVLHWFANNQAPLSRTPSAVTVYDLLAFRAEAPWRPAKRIYLQSMIRRVVSSANVLLPISQATATELRSVLGASPERMEVIPSILPSVFQPATSENVAALRTAYGLPPLYWLYVANFYAHKNHATLIEAYRRLAQEDPNGTWPLVLRGDQDSGITQARRQIAAAGIGHRIILLPRLETSEMPALYSAAGAVVFPSSYEGLGIPVVEAMACGCPVLASPLPAVIESGGDAIRVVDTLDPDTLADAMRALQKDTIGRRLMREKGLERSGQFRSSVVTPKLFAAYRRICAG